MTVVTVVTVLTGAYRLCNVLIERALLTCVLFYLR